ncbi:MAG: hypothetical protein IKE29_06270 [Paenibacillus sp.]|uniref:hypothetical protein n=1 Tax=Paenibacillus sp. TaxID=58172 RepID=UPI0025E260C0|nr:hypothetical protein [Paenibacillus sp.]MBR2564210.1 hypothetical protein [Paenibacillus sp.]
MQYWNGTPIMEAPILHQWMRVMAVLDIILCDEEWLRVHRYHELRPDIAWGSVDNGTGDHLHVLFTNTGTLIKGFDHESPLSPYAREDGEIYPGMYEGIPEELHSILCQHEEELNREDVTCCIWQEGDDLKWKTGSWMKYALAEEHETDAEGGLDFLLGYIEETPEAYIDWAEGYYDMQEMSLAAVTEIYNHAPVNADLIRRLNPNRKVSVAMDEIKECGWAVQGF